MFAFTSTGGSGNLIGAIYDGHGPPCYKIQGKMHHRLGPLMAEDGQAPIYSQLYIYDTAQALQYRMQKNPKLDASTLHTLQYVIDDLHPFIDTYKQAYELTQTTDLLEYHIQLDLQTSSNCRRYNLPTTNHEIAALLPGDIDACINSRDVIIRAQGGALLRTTECHPAYLTLHFPLFFPTDQPGWEPNMPYS